MAAKHKVGEEWNTDEAWISFVASLDPLIDSITSKYSQDAELKEDAAQNARIELLYVRPEQVRGFEDYVRGVISFDRWQEILKSFCAMVIRNEVLSTLSSHTTGNIYTGRKQVRRTVDENGKVHRVRKHIPARYMSLDQLVETGVQVTDTGEVVWWKHTEVRNGDKSSDDL